jgi:hypothetical protein
MTTANLTVIENVLFKRGNTATLSTYTGVTGEVLIDTTLKTLRVQDGVTAGGTRLATYTELGTQSTLANANAVTQTTEINSLRANITAANAAITSLQSNAAIQATLLDTLTGNAATQSQVLDTLTSNAATQANTLSTLLGNAITQQTSLIDLLANAATQSQQIASSTGTYSNANVATYLSAFDGNIIPAANVTYSLGNQQFQWSELWVSNNTIYIGNTPIRVANGQLLVNNAPVSGSYSNANVASYLSTYTGNIAANIVSPTVPTIGGTASAGEAGITYLSGDLSKWAIFTEGAFTVGVWTDVQPGWTVTDNNGFTDTIAGRGSFGAASFQTTVNNWPAPASGKTYVFTSPGYQLGYTNPIEITIGSNDWRFGTDGTLTFPTGGNLIFDSSAASVIDGVTSITANGNISASQYNFANGVNILSTVAGTYGNANVASYLPTYTGNIAVGNVITTVDTNLSVVTGRTLTTNNSYTNTVDFSTDVEINGDPLAGWYQRNSEQIEFALFGPSAFQTYLTGLALGRTVIVTYSTGSGNQTITRPLTQIFAETGQTDPANPTWGRVSGRIDATLPADQTGIVSINFPVYSTESHTWTFDLNGDLTAPGDITTGTNGGRFVQDCGDGITSIRWINIDENNDAALLRFYTGDPGEESGDAERAQIRLNWQSADQSGLTIKSFDQDSNEEHDWEFRGDGDLRLPGDGEIIIRDNDNEVGRIIPDVSDGGGLTVQAEVDLELKVNDGEGGSAIWSFEPDGGIVFPDDTVQTTAWTGILPNPTYSGSDQIGEATPAPLNLNNSAASTLLTQLNLINTGGGGGAGSAIDFWTYTSINDVPEVRLQAVDDGDYSADFAIKIKAKGESGLGSLTTSWTFGADGNLTLPGNTFAVNYANGTAVSLGGSYGNADVATFLAEYGSNTISTTGNITGNFFIGDGSQLTGITANTANITSNVITFNTAAGIEVAAGQMAWNSSDGTLDIGLSYANVVLQVGQETHYVVRNDTGNIIENGTAVYCSGVAGGSGRIEASPMMGNIDAVKFLGLSTQDISNGVNGVITYFGYVRGLDTRGTANTAISVGDETWAVGDQLYVHPTAAGKLTNVEPAAPNVKICVASVIIRNQTAGVVFVRPTTNLTAADLSDVQITSPVSDQILLYDNNRWENVNFGIDIDTTPTLGGNLAGAGFNVSNVGNISATGNVSAQYLIIDGGLISTGASPAPIISGFSSISTTGARGNITASGNLIAGTNIIASGGVTARNINADYGNISLNPDFGLIFTQSNAVITANTASWTFGTAGSLTFPDASVQTTAFTGNAATIDITDTNGIDTNYYLTFVENRDSEEILRADVDLIFNSADNTLTAGNITTGILKINDGVHEKYQELADATGTVTHDCSAGHLFYHSSPDANWTVNLTNLNLSVGYATTITIIIDQGNTGYYPNALQVSGSAQTINWQGNATPTPSTNRLDIVSFSILAVSGGYIVFGQLTGF